MFKLQSFQRVVLQDIIIAQQGVLPFCMRDAPRGFPADASDCLPHGSRHRATDSINRIFAPFR
ncbi:hypothetical protein EQ839_08825 [Limosilactobacillus mucosae]|nr:hypothetical protein EQ839_08825 [Limosilactobacillus mucosae]